MNVLLLGTNGQLGWELQRTCPENIILSTCDYPKIDFCSTNNIRKYIETTNPDYIINTAAYTAVDNAEQEKELAYKINHAAVVEIAELCKKKSIFLIQISTDFIFNGHNFKPYLPNDVPNPKSVYDKSKLMGEQAVIKIIGDQALILRTAWLYSSHGNNFVKNMLTFMKEKSGLNVIDVQIGTPTWAHGLAKSIWIALENNLTGTFHWTDAGVASWYDFAMAIQEEGLTAGLLDKTIPISPVPTYKFPTPAERPMYSVLDKTAFWNILGIKPIHWRVQLRAMLKELVQ